MLRYDFRKNNEARLIRHELGVVIEAEGSCKYYQGNTIVTAFLNSFTTNKTLKQERFDRSSLQVKISTGSDDIKKNKFAEDYIYKSILPAIKSLNYPRKQFVLTIIVVHDDGSSIACAINASVLALFNAGISMVSVPISVCVLKQSDNTLIFDPALNEEINDSSDLHIFTFSDISSKVSIICSSIIQRTPHDTSPQSIIDKNKLQAEIIMNAIDLANSIFNMCFN